MTAMRHYVTAMLLSAFVLAPLTAHASDDAASRYTLVRASPDGIGKVYAGREIAQVMSFHGAQWLERSERMEEERPDLVIAALELKPGMQVADVGAGTGFYAWRMAQKVGASGTVYAVDIQPEMIAMLDKQIARRATPNVKAVLGTPTDPRLPAGALDLVVMVDVYHEFAYPFEMLGALALAIKPGGHLVFVEFRGNDAKVPIKPLHTMTEAQLRREASLHPLEWVRTVRNLPWQHVVVFRRR